MLLALAQSLAAFQSLGTVSTGTRQYVRDLTISIQRSVSLVIHHRKSLSNVIGPLT